VAVTVLPYRNPERLVLACSDVPRCNVKDFPFSNADFIDLRNGGKNMFEDFAGVITGRAMFPRADGAPERNRFATVTPNFFRLLGAQIPMAAISWRPMDYRSRSLPSR
jgi:hypothetical protein